MEFVRNDPGGSRFIALDDIWFDVRAGEIESRPLDGCGI